MMEQIESFSRPRFRWKHVSYILFLNQDHGDERLAGGRAGQVSQVRSSRSPATEEWHGVLWTISRAPGWASQVSERTQSLHRRVKRSRAGKEASRKEKKRRREGGGMQRNMALTAHGLRNKWGLGTRWDGAAGQRAYQSEPRDEGIKEASVPDYMLLKI
ncbi:hypothetical protein AXG93_3105s1140 [Marchantia polymorpha subsp. ruderalis]|uniref:Uncharacterized protein n=1 Tax=Marchantia polymorpha subsp. ruderalis TaxID=1480154 RepID=A0A176WJ90_MARPO|nr:hypothetical protein AXG93_3105s1140 [Marchantia polymorpha subsp. ruderalis]